MPFMGGLPSNRRGRFVWRQQRYRHRVRHQQGCWGIHVFDGVKWVRVGRYQYPNTGPQQQPSGVRSNPGGAFDQAAHPFLKRVVSGGGDGTPPHCRLEFGNTGVRLRNVGPTFWNIRLANFHFQRVKTCRRRGGGMSALQRRVWGANWFYYYNGIFPDADPLGRTPNETSYDPATDTLNAEGPFPTITPWDV
jgi:hypothetical protein